jgi:hypothetical protein
MCDKCGKKLGSRQMLRHHMLRHLGIRNFKCDECPSTFVAKEGLTHHKQRVHQRKANKPTAEPLRKIKKEKPILPKKIKLKDMVGPSFCSFCGKEFKDVNTALKHERQVSFNLNILKIDSPYIFGYFTRFI